MAMGSWAYGGISWRDKASNGIAYRVGKEVLDEGLEVLYDVPGRISQSFLVNTPVPTGPWRGVMSAAERICK